MSPLMILGAWYLIGLLSLSCCVFLDYYSGKDIEVEDLMATVIYSIFGPFMFIFLALYYLWPRLEGLRYRVLIKGKKR